MKILVMGAGAIGGYVGGKLAAQHDVTLLGRARLIEATRARGLHLVEPESDQWVRNIRVVESVEAAFQNVERFELTVFSVKTYDTSAAIDQLRPYARQIDRFVSLQNGVRSEEILGDAFGREKIIAGTILNPISIPEPGAVRLEKRKGGLGLAAVESQPLDSIVSAFSSINLPLRVYADYRSMKWSKLPLNLIGNATSAILDMTTRETFADPRVFKVEIAALREAVDVMRAQSIKPAALPGYPVPLLVFALRFLPIPLLRMIMRPLATSGRGDKPPSLLMDLRSGKSKSEIDDLNGAVVQAGSTIGRRTPVNEFLTKTVQDLVSGHVERAAWRRRIDRLVNGSPGHELTGA
jgi:2-dehydropantoate 2-reductase